MYVVLDIETTYQGKFGSDGSDPSPYNSNNKLVSVGYRTSTGVSNYLYFNHKHARFNLYKNVKELQEVLSSAELVVGHNLKFDMAWLYESGFTYEGKLYDTMIYEYVTAKGLPVALSLADTLTRYKLPNKLDILYKYCGEMGLNVDEVPVDELTEYGIADVNNTFELFKAQKLQLKEDKLTASMLPAIKLMNEFLEVLIDVERHGVSVDLDALDNVEDQFRSQHKLLEQELKEIITKVMGHTPININSGEQISWVLHSIKVKDKDLWKQTFNLGTDVRNGVKKKKYTKKYTYTELRQILREQCVTIRKTIAHQCETCKGTGYIQKYTVKGDPYKRKNVCHECSKTGIIYTDTNDIGGFRIKPLSSLYAADGGFSTSKSTLDLLLDTDLDPLARKFITLYKEYNAISSYLATFVEGIRRNVVSNDTTNILHTSFNQCVTATGRLSSTRPNLQNQPRESTFPIRKVFVSRFENGVMLNADYSQLEFRVAAFLAQCSNAIDDIKNKIDVHQQTADAITAAGEPTSRQDAKKSTFRPLYGGTSGTDAQKAYFEYFFSRYDGIFKWHNTLCDIALDKKYIQSPSGRVYAFPHVARRNNGSVAFATQIKNYLVQGFATGDILPITMIEMYKLIKRLRKERGLKSVLCLTVHDSIVADCHPDEVDVMVEVFGEAFRQTITSIKERFGVEFNVPLDFDLDIGYNLLDKQKIKYVYNPELLLTSA